MTSLSRTDRLRRAALTGVLLAGGVSAAPGTARADADADDKISRLLDLLVQKRIVTSKQAHALLRQTEDGPVRRARPSVAAAEPGEAPPSKHGEIRVTYVPQFVRKQIADEVRAQVMTESREEGWAAPNALPEWTQRFHLYGDLRVRYERDGFDRNNGQFINYAAINQGNAFDTQGPANGGALPPFLNTSQDRDRERVRARLGVQAQVDDWLTADFRLSTGSDQGPITPNQTQGAPGDFAKYSAYIDRANFTGKPLPGLTLLAGRFNNPFNTTDLIFYSELGFDGVAASYTHPITSGTSAYITGGAFPILNTAFDFSTNASNKYESTNAYLLAVQGGGEWKARPDVLAKLGVGFFDFNGVQGAVSRPCNVQGGNVYICNTDSTRFPFQQFGNTVFGIRDIVQPPSSTPGTLTTPEYFGLASRFAVLEVHPRVEISTFAPYTIALDGEYIKNLAFNRAAILNHYPANYPIGPENNYGSAPKGAPAGTVGPYQGGDTGYIFRAQVGNLQIHKLWDWNVMAAYKYVETDATLDSITDSDFHLGGTNAKGYILTGSLGIAKDTFLSLRYFSAQVVSGPPDGNRVLQLDLQSTF